MIEWLAFPVLLAGMAALPKGKRNDRKTIELVFKNQGYGIPKPDKKWEFPRFIRKIPIYDGKPQTKEEEVEMRIATEYLYSLPPGLPGTKMCVEEKKTQLFSDSIRKPTDVYYDRKKGLVIRVYDEELPEFLPFCARDKETGRLKLELPERNDGFWVPLGKAQDGFVWQNFTHTPHITGAGTTRYGKSVMLRSIMTYLILMHGDNVEFYVIDLKGGLEFKRYEKIRQVKYVAGSAAEALALLTGITNENPKAGPIGLVEQQMAQYLKKGWGNTEDAKEKKRRFIIVDEGAQLAPDALMKGKDKETMLDCQTKLAKIAGVAGGLGFSLIFTTQYPVSTTMPRLVKQNSDGKISFRLPSGYASEVAIDEYGAEKLPSQLKGRALFKTHELKEMQTPFLSHSEMWELLDKYQIPVPLEGEPENVVEYREEAPAGGTDTKQSGNHEVFNPPAAPNHSRVRFEP